MKTPGRTTSYGELATDIEHETIKMPTKETSSVGIDPSGS
jgi:hypothetical protein